MSFIKRVYLGEGKSGESFYKRQLIAYNRYLLYTALWTLRELNYKIRDGSFCFHLLFFLPWSYVLESKKRSNRKTSSQKTKRTTKKRSGLFKKKQIKPKVKLDSNRVMGLCIVIVIACVLLLLGTLLIPDGTLNSNTVPASPVEHVEQTKPTVDQKKQSDKENQKRLEEKKRQEEEQRLLEQKRQEEEQRKKEEAKKQAEKEAYEKQLAEEQRKKDEAKAKAQEEEKKRQQQQQQSASFNFPKAVNNAQLVFLLDDGGQNLSHLDKFLKLPMPLTIAVLPRLTHSREAAQKIRASGKELMLHQPMQALNASVNPGPGAIKPEMTREQIISTLFQNIDEVGPVAGMNNHEGSAITADAQKMEVILKYAAENGIFFLDSRTNKDTQVPYVSHALGYSYYERNGNFLDNVKTRENALAELRKNIDKANKDGVVIMIGHVWSADFLPQLLMDVYPELKAKGYVITTVSKCKGRK